VAALMRMVVLGDAWNGATRPWGMGGHVTPGRPAVTGTGKQGMPVPGQVPGDGQESFHGATPFEGSLGPLAHGRQDLSEALDFVDFQILILLIFQDTPDL